MRNLILILSLLSFHSFAQWKLNTFENKASFRAIDMLDSTNIWISGSKGSILKSTDSGKTWKNVCPEQYKAFDFRGISALNPNEIVAMSAGDGSEGKAFLIKSSNGGKTWNMVLEKKEKGVFFDSIKFKDSKNGFVLGDAIDKKPYLLQTKNGGMTWSRVKNLPDIMVGEASFAASNSCISIYKNQVWFNTQNRIFYSKNLGKSWEVLETPFESGRSLGIFGTFFFSKTKGMIVGGDYVDDKKPTLQYAFTENAGKLWQTKENYSRYGLTECVSKISENIFISVGTIGTAISTEKGKTWKEKDKESFHVVSCKDNKCVAAGGNGRIGTSTHFDIAK
ncbi:MAG: hypothetical protein K9I84_09390 [Leadbetterella sp.]|nr:hypothetical protein [Leadbetterella sp.]